VDFGTTPASVNARSVCLSGFARGYEFFPEVFFVSLFFFVIDRYILV